MTGNKAIDKVLLIINLVGTLGAMGLVVYANNFIKPPKTDHYGEFDKLTSEGLALNELPPVELPKMVVNLYSRQTRLRFLDLKMHLEYFKESDSALIENAKPLIQDALIAITGNMTPDEVNSITGRLLLESRLKGKINFMLGKKAVKKIYFSRYIIQ